MKKDNIAIVLGGTAPHIELINNLKRRGYYTILIDYFDNPPAKVAADEHIKESTLDQERVLLIAKQLDARLVISTCVDRANVTACYVGEKLGLPIPYSYQTALEVSNKVLMKQKMMENGIPTSRYYEVDASTDLDSIKLDFPVMVKPADCCGSAGVKKATTIDELESFLQYALTLSRTRRAIVEKFVSGFEVSVYSYVSDKKAHLLLTSQRFSLIDGNNKVIKCFASIAPADLPERSLKIAEKISNDIARIFHLDNTPLFFQALINDNNDVNVIEFAARLGGGLCFRTIKEITGFDIIDASIDSFLGKRVHVNDFIPKCYYLTHQLYGNRGVFDKVVNSEKLIREGIIEEIHYHKTKGMQIETDKAGSSRIAAFLSKSQDKTQLLDSARHAISEMDVIDINNKSILRKDIYLTKTR